jgi:hypothetical protein
MKLGQEPQPSFVYLLLDFITGFETAPALPVVPLS